MRWPFFKKLSPEDIKEELEILLEDVADFCDRHHVFVPSMTVRSGPVELELSMKRLPTDVPPSPEPEKK
mgnify:FL=1